MPQIPLKLEDKCIYVIGRKAYYSVNSKKNLLPRMNYGYLICMKSANIRKFIFQNCSVQMNPKVTFSH